MLMKTTRLIIDRQLKRKFSANKKKQKTEYSSSLGDQVGYRKKLNIQNVDGIEKGDENLIFGSCQKGSSSNWPVKTNTKSKTRRSSILRKDIRGRKKRKMEKVVKVDEVVEPMDLISELPVSIIHHILSFLRCPRDVARTTVLSKKWRSICASFFTLDFDQKRFKMLGGDHMEKFITFVDNSFTTKLEPMHNIQKFKLSLSQLSPKLKLRINEWISASINKDVKELEIHVEEKKKRHYMLPNIVLTAKTLTSLKLYGCKLDGKGVIDLRNLKELSIKNAYVNADVIQGFVQGCPLVEDLRLVHCTGIGRLQISTLHKLSRVELHECHGLVCVHIELPSLLRFLYWGKESWECNINLAGCANLKYLTLRDSNLTDELFQDQMSKLFYLEKLVLRGCDKLERIIILSVNLKELSVIRCKKLEVINIYAPYLSVLEYSGGKFPFSSMDVLDLHEAKLHLEVRKNRFVVLHELLVFLQKFENDGAWTLVVSSNKNITIHEELRKIQNLSSNDLKLELIKSPVKLKGYVDNLLRMSRPKTLSLVSSSSSELLKSVKEKIMSREENPKCCTYYLKKCWLHYIKDVTMVVFEAAEIGETSQNLQQTTFRFNWQS
ncbi:F-box/FBD/LRR-repeat protein At5g44980 isoform X1 [Cynara cardunculus var. scolymus]|uniref:F-box/FBD/LRR-repeat protein At5g44980 isoform X1 n=1 Tax=Cynara cardunculus var. scolymus TaxID=59895 RepID=UPI000D6266BA|nr:F-box/FBD/LRR-repeat protein At5g44980 isoform X1 [Cynara cardunculus var. scolymus]XP_024970000.1 F-box/FBD/LRR-repeat protein At5g44980 isoform X1 [Cynara cardunculus var. scolymus]XP_024970002.1 F-box/FBD/LRR-repeat protein At5g44980 isoform X1 [Cynara cardunculus var. scolymus]XP_024970003.1 F-box/FBD/LRR-repeat protein At5g44980 isoform X1 [Cynara cardunculus var. scolymus]